MSHEIVEVLIELGLTPLDWVDASIFSKLTGIEEKKLTHRRKNWPQDFVWTKQDGNIYYSLRGYNQWLTDQTRKRYQLAFESEMVELKSTSPVKNNATSLHSRTRQPRKVSGQPLKLEVT